MLFEWLFFVLLVLTVQYFWACSKQVIEIVFFFVTISFFSTDICVAASFSQQSRWKCVKVTSVFVLFFFGGGGQSLQAARRLNL